MNKKLLSDNGSEVTRADLHGKTWSHARSLRQAFDINCLFEIVLRYKGEVFLRQNGGRSCC